MKRLHIAVKATRYSDKLFCRKWIWICNHRYDCQISSWYGNPQCGYTK